MLLYGHLPPHIYAGPYAKSCTLLGMVKASEAVRDGTLRALNNHSSPLRLFCGMEEVLPDLNTEHTETLKPGHKSSNRFSPRPLSFSMQMSGRHALQSPTLLFLFLFFLIGE